MHKKISDFLAKNRPKGARSKLWPHYEVILELREFGASLQQVCDYLMSEEEVVITKQYLSIFIQKISKQKHVSAKPTRIQPIEKSVESKVEEEVEKLTNDSKPIIYGAVMPKPKFNFTIPKKRGDS